MAVTVTLIKDGFDVLGGRYRAQSADITMDNSYDAGGEAITPAKVGLKTIVGALILGGNAASAVLKYAWDTTNNKLMAIFPTGGKAAAAPTTLANPIVATGASTASAVDAVTPTVVPGIGQEVGATTDLSSHIVRVLFIGY